MPARKSRRWTGTRFTPFDRQSSARPATQRLRRLNVFATHEEQVSTASAMLFAPTTTPNSASTHPRSSINTSARETNRPYPSPAGQRALKRPISMHRYAPERARPESVSRQSANQPVAPAPHVPSRAPPGRAALYPPTTFGPVSATARPYIDPTSPNAWNPSNLTYGIIGQGIGRSSRQPGAPGPQSNFPTLNSASHFIPTGILVDSPVLSPLFDPFVNPRSPQILSSPQEVTVLPQVPENAGRSMHRSNVLVNQTVSPLPLSAPLFLPPHELEVELMKGDRSRFTWVNWEQQNVMSGLLGPHASPDLIKHLAQKKRSELASHACWLELSKGPFGGTRTPSAILTQWLSLRDTYQEIIQFAESAGLDLTLSKFKDPPVFVNAVVAAWEANVGPGAGWGTKLKPPVVAAWTHNPANGWLAMLYRRLTELNIELPPREASDQPTPTHSRSPSVRPSWTGHTHNEPEDPSSAFSAPQLRAQAVAPSSDTAITPPSQVDPTSPDQLGHGPVQPVQPIQPIQPAQPAENAAYVESDVGSVLDGYSHGWEMSDEQREVATASTSLVDHARAGYIHSLALQARAETLGYLLGLEQREREMRLYIAMKVIHEYEPTSTSRVSAETWVRTTFFSSHPSEDFTRLASDWKAKLDATPIHLTYDPDLEQIFATCPLPPLDLSDSLEVDGLV
ncbi:hypothetical protein FS749_015931 [Ceratobasidium sp. UAMH 11750]|nr:hypothetical protein FS749_015931 [Ceratobasidium sp. UAMH 11750]